MGTNASIGSRRWISAVACASAEEQRVECTVRCLLSPSSVRTEILRANGSRWSLRNSGTENWWRFIGEISTLRRLSLGCQTKLVITRRSNYQPTTTEGAGLICGIAIATSLRRAKSHERNSDPLNILALMPASLACRRFASGESNAGTGEVGLELQLNPPRRRQLISEQGWRRHDGRQSAVPVKAQDRRNHLRKKIFEISKICDEQRLWPVLPSSSCCFSLYRR